MVTLFVVLIAIIETDPATVGVISNPKVQLVAGGEHTVIRLSCTYVQLEVLVEGSTVNITPLLAVPPTVTTTLPVVAPAGTCAVMLVALQPVIVVAVVPLNLTVLVIPCVAPKFAPMIATEVPTRADVGKRLVMVGAEAGLTVRVAGLLVTLPLLLVTTTMNCAPLSEIAVAGVV